MTSEITMNDTKSDVRISIIIPIHNAKDYILRCFHSVATQNYGNLEIIIVDDGSNDGSLEIIRKMVRGDDRVNVFSTKHSGPNAARKFGLEKATGNYVMFVDADDFLEQGAIELLARKLEVNDVDVVKFGAKYFPSGEEVMPILDHKDKEVVLKHAEIAQLLAISDKLNSLWGKLYKRCILNDISAFDYDLNLGEDLLINVGVYSRINRMLVVSDLLYNYRNNNSNSVTRNQEKNRILNNIRDRIFVTGEMLGFIRNNVADRQSIIKGTYKQLKAIWEVMKRLVWVDGYDKEDFKADFRAGIAGLNLTDADVRNIRRYTGRLRPSEYLKNGSAVRALAEKDCDKVWRAFCRYRMLRKVVRRKR